MESEDLLQGHKKIVFAFFTSVKDLEKEMLPCQIKTLIDQKLGISKNHKMMEVGRDLRRSFSPPPCSRRTTQYRIPMSISKHFLEITLGDSTNSVGNQCQSLTQHRKLSWCLHGTTCVPVCAHCLLSCLFSSFLLPFIFQSKVRFFWKEME